MSDIIAIVIKKQSDPIAVRHFVRDIDREIYASAQMDRLNRSYTQKTGVKQRFSSSE